MNSHSLLDIATRAVAICSVLYTILPPFEVFNDFPSVQKFYKVLLAFVGGIAVNARSKVYPSLSTSNGNTTSQAASSAIVPGPLPNGQTPKADKS